MGAAIELGAAGAFVHAVSRTLDPGTGGAPGSLMETVTEIERLGGRGRAAAYDCGDYASLQTLFAEVRRMHGRLDVLVNSVFASHAFGEFVDKRIWELDAKLMWHDVVDLPGRAAYFATACAAPLLMETAARGDGALIVNVSGRGAVRYRYNVPYGVGKSAIARLTRDSALEFKPHGVAVVAIWPNGHTHTPPETPRYNGRGIAALAADRNRMARSGDGIWTAQLGADYGFTDEFGNVHPVGDLTDSFSLEHPPT